MRIFEIENFNDWVKKIGITDEILIKAIEEITLNPKKWCIGKNLYKPRIALDGKGKRRGARAVVACKIKDKAFFLYGYAKNAKDNITKKELKVYKKLAIYWLRMDDKKVQESLKTKEITEVKNG